MKAKTNSKDAKSTKPAVKVQDLKPKTDPVGGHGHHHGQHAQNVGGQHRAERNIGQQS